MQSMLRIPRSFSSISHSQWHSLQKCLSTTTYTTAQSQLKQIPGDTSIDRTPELFDATDQYGFYNKLQAEHPNDNLIKFNFLNTDHIIAYDNATARSLLGLESRGFARDIFPSHWGLLLGPKSISNIGGQEHSKIRDAYKPAFTHRAMEPLTPIIAEITIKALDEMYAECNKTNDFIEVGKYCLRWQWNIGVQTLFGDNFFNNEENEQLHDLFDVYISAFAPTDGKGADDPTSMLYNGVQAYEKLKIYIRDNIFAKAFKMHEQQTLRKNSLLHKMITTPGQPALTETETFCPLDSTLFLMWAAHHTTATGAAAMLNNFAGNPHIVETLNDELYEEFGDHINLMSVDYDTLYQLKYLDATIKEGLRITPPVNMVFRQITQDMELGGYHVKDGDIFMVPIGFYQNRQEGWGENVDEFEPQRFIDKTKNYGITFSPFAKASRLCIGMNLAYLDLKMLAVALAAGKYKFEIDGDWKAYPDENKGQLLKNKVKVVLK